MGPFDWLPHAPLEPLQLDWLQGVELAVLRLDCIDPLISGNKWFKLTGHLAQAHCARGVISLGGAYSNHLHALAGIYHHYILRDNTALRMMPGKRANY